MSKREQIFNILGGKCFYCGCDLSFDNFHLDHIKAKSKGGIRENNLVPSCPECNIYKSDLEIEEFREKIANALSSNSHGKIINKYYKIEYKPITFYFEEVGYGTL